MEPAEIRDLAERLRVEVHKAVVGQDDVVDLLLTALLTPGHVLVEGVPGTAKTLLARAFASGLLLTFNRIQFTPDLMPGDVIGTNLFDFRTNAFVLTKGPLFTELLLADEVNRTPPKTQAALLQAMQERVVTLDGVTWDLSHGFMVIATQNPIEQEGTWPLPEAQLDRFLFKARIAYPSRDEERALVRLHGRGADSPDVEALGVRAVASPGVLAAARRSIAELRLESDVVDYIVDIVRATRRHPALLAGASPRAATMLAAASRARAALDGRAYVLPDDVKFLSIPTLAHRVVLSPAAELDGLTPEVIVRQVVHQVSVPR